MIWPGLAVRRSCGGILASILRWSDIARLHSQAAAFLLPRQSTPEIEFSDIFCQPPAPTRVGFEILVGIAFLGLLTESLYRPTGAAFSCR